MSTMLMKKTVGLCNLDWSERKIGLSFPLLKGKMVYGSCEGIFFNQEKKEFAITNGKSLLVCKMTEDEKKEFLENKVYGVDKKVISEVFPPYEKVLPEIIVSFPIEQSISELISDFRSIKKQGYVRSMTDVINNHLIIEKVECKGNFLESVLRGLLTLKKARGDVNQISYMMHGETRMLFNDEFKLLWLELN